MAVCFGLSPCVLGAPTLVHQWVIGDPSQDADAIDISWTVPSEGRLQFVLSNPDASRDGHFMIGIEEGDSYNVWLRLDTCCHSSFEGVLWGAACEGTEGHASNQIDLDVLPGSTVIRLDYVSRGGVDNAGPDTLSVFFDADPIDTSDAIYVTTFTAGAQEAAAFETSVTGPGQILVDVTSLGTDGNKGGLLMFYVDGVAVSCTSSPGGWKEGHPFTEPHLLAIPVAEGTHAFKITNEDSKWDDNVGNRVAELYVSDLDASTEEDDVVFMSDRSGNWDIWRMKPDGSELIRLTFDSAREENPHWSADGSQIAYTNTSDGIHVMNADGTGDQLVPNTSGSCLVKDWGPCDKIFYTNGAGEVVEINPDGTGKRMLNDGNDGNYPQGSWSPDCAEFVWGEGTPGVGGSANIQISPVAAFDPRQVLPPTTSPVEWSPNGAWILYHQDPGFSKVRPDGSDAEVILAGLHTEYASFLADSDSFIYSDHDDLWRSDLSGTGPTQLTSGADIDTHVDVLKIGVGVALPAAPSCLTATGVGSDQINLVWADNSVGETGFKIERKPNGGTYSVIDTAGENVTAYQDSPIASGTYCYRVAAYTASGDSGYSNESCGATTMDSAFERVYVTDFGAHKVVTADLDGSDAVRHDVAGCEAHGPLSIAINPIDQKLYVSNWTESEIIMADLDGSNAETLVQLAGAIDGPNHIALDIAAGKMYIANENTNSVTVANLDGSSPAVLDLGGTLNEPYGIALDVAAGKMYVQNYSGAIVNVVQANLDGSFPVVMDLDGQLSNSRDIALDLVARKMYVVNTGTDSVTRANLDGTCVEVLHVGGMLSLPYGIALDVPAGEMFVVNYGTDNVARASLDGTNPQILALTEPLNAAGDIELGPVCGAAPPTKGDANGDGEVTWVDAVIFHAWLHTKRKDLTPEEFAQADVNCDGKFTGRDVVLVAQYVIGMIDEFPC